MLPNHWGPGGKPGKLFDGASVTHLHHKQEACPYSLSLVVFFCREICPACPTLHISIPTSISVSIVCACMSACSAAFDIARSL